MIWTNIVSHVKYYQLKEEVMRNPLEEIDFLHNVEEEMLCNA